MLLAMLDNRPAPVDPPSLDLTQLNAALASTGPAPLPKRSWHARADRRTTQPRRTSDKSDKSQKSAKSNKSGQSNKSGKSDGRISLKLGKLPPVDLSLPLSRLSEALDLAPLSLPTPSSKERRATKAALALRTLILDPPALEVVALSIPAIPPMPQKGTKGRKSSAQIPQLREKDVERLRTQLLKPEEAKMVIASARNLYIDKPNAAVERAVCLDCSESQADQLIVEAKRIEAARRQKEEHLDAHRFSTLKSAPPPPPRLPVLLSLFAGLTSIGTAVQASGADSNIMTLGLFEPASAMSLHRPLAGALPSADTLRRGFDALINAESKIYLYDGPSHKNIHPPLDRISVYTYWWGFEIALPPPTLEYLDRAKSIATSILNLLSVIVYAVPGGTRELAPFVGVLSRYIENEWNLLKSQDKGKGVVCGATWFIPAALTARPWDFGEETLRDRNENHEISINPPEPPEEAIVRVSGPKGEAEGVVLGVGRGLGIGNVEATPSHPTSPGAPATRDPSQTIGPGWKKKAPIPAPHAHTQVICDEHRSMHTGAVNPSPLAHTLASVDEGQSQPSSANSSAVSTPEIEVWVKPAETKRSPSILSTSRFKRSKQKAKPPPIDPSKANAPIDSPLDSPAASSIPTPSDTASTPKPTPPSPRPATDTSLVTLADHFVSDTLRLLKGTLGRKGGRPARNIPWHHKHGDEKKEGMTGSLAQESGAKKGIRHGRSLFELRRFYNRSM